MPIRFRCSRCNRLLGIARRKAGADTTCPHCGTTITVPNPTEQTELAEIDELVNPASAAIAAPPAGQWWQQADLAEAIPVASMPATPVPKPAAKPMPLPDDEHPLFERDVDSVLGVKSADRPEGAKQKPAVASGTDAMSIVSERNQVVLSSQMVTALAVAAVVLLALAFAAGYLVASL